MQVTFSRDRLDREQQQIVITGFEEHSQEMAAPPFGKEPLKWVAYKGNQLVGVLTAEVLWDWVYIDELWVDKDQRGKGIAKDLMLRAEQTAAAEGMTGLWLWTQSWQAGGFYEHLGYHEFTRFEDFPKGHQRIGYRKRCRR